MSQNAQGHSFETVCLRGGGVSHGQGLLGGVYVTVNVWAGMGAFRLASVLIVHTQSYLTF